jgi:hypothetical protein
MSESDRPEPPDLDLETWHRAAPFPPTWEERDRYRQGVAETGLPPRLVDAAVRGVYGPEPRCQAQPRLDTGYLFGPDPIPRRRAPK